MSDEARLRIVENPFYVLGLRPDATRHEIEREGQKLLGMLELGLARAASYATPLGSEERTADKVRVALAELRDPEKRIIHEVWAALEPRIVVELEDEPAPVPDPDASAWSDLLRRLGWGG
jgi:hypothetical protein